MGFLSKLFGGGGSKREPADSGIYFYVRCARCGRVLHTRLEPLHDLSESDEGFETRKEMMDDRCFRPLFLNVTFDANRRVREAQVEGGTLIDRATWEAEKDLPRRPPAPDTPDNL